MQYIKSQNVLWYKEVVLIKINYFSNLKYKHEYKSKGINSKFAGTS